MTDKTTRHGGPRAGSGRKAGNEWAEGYEPRHYTNIGLSPTNYLKLRATSEQTGKSMAKIINELIEKNF